MFHKVKSLLFLLLTHSSFSFGMDAYLGKFARQQEEDRQARIAAEAKARSHLMSNFTLGDFTRNNPDAARNIQTAQSGMAGVYVGTYNQLAPHNPIDLSRPLGHKPFTPTGNPYRDNFMRNQFPGPSMPGFVSNYLQQPWNHLSGTPNTKTLAEMTFTSRSGNGLTPMQRTILDNIKDNPILVRSYLRGWEEEARKTEEQARGKDRSSLWMGQEDRIARNLMQYEGPIIPQFIKDWWNSLGKKPSQPQQPAPAAAPATPTVTIAPTTSLRSTEGNAAATIAAFAAGTLTATTALKTFNSTHRTTTQVPTPSGKHSDTPALASDRPTKSLLTTLSVSSRPRSTAGYSSHGKTSAHAQQNTQTPAQTKSAADKTPYTDTSNSKSVSSASHNPHAQEKGAATDQTQQKTHQGAAATSGSAAKPAVVANTSTSTTPNANTKQTDNKNTKNNTPQISGHEIDLEHNVVMLYGTHLKTNIPKTIPPALAGQSFVFDPATNRVMKKDSNSSKAAIDVQVAFLTKEDVQINPKFQIENPQIAQAFNVQGQWILTASGQKVWAPKQLTNEEIRNNPLLTAATWRLSPELARLIELAPPAPEKDPNILNILPTLKAKQEKQQKSEATPKTSDSDQQQKKDNRPKKTTPPEKPKSEPLSHADQHAQAFPAATSTLLTNTGVSAFQDSMSNHAQASNQKKYTTCAPGGRPLTAEEEKAKQEAELKEAQDRYDQSQEDYRKQLASRTPEQVKKDKEEAQAHIKAQQERARALAKPVMPLKKYTLEDFTYEQLRSTRGCNFIKELQATNDSQLQTQKGQEILKQLEADDQKKHEESKLRRDAEIARRGTQSNTHTNNQPATEKSKATPPAEPAKTTLPSQPEASTPQKEKKPETQKEFFERLGEVAKKRKQTTKEREEKHLQEPASRTASFFTSDFTFGVKQSNTGSNTAPQYSDAYLSALQSYTVPVFNAQTTNRSEPSSHKSAPTNNQQPQLKNNTSSGWTDTIYKHANTIYTYAQKAAQSYVNSIPSTKDAFKNTVYQAAWMNAPHLFAKYPLAATGAAAGLSAAHLLWRASGLSSLSYFRRNSTQTHVQPAHPSYSSALDRQPQVTEQENAQPILFSAAGVRISPSNLVAQQLNNEIQAATATILKNNAEYDLQLQALSQEASVRAAGDPYNAYTKACADAIESACEISSSLNSNGFAQQASALRNLAEAMNLAADAKIKGEDTGAAYTSASRPEAITIQNVTHALRKSFAGLHQASAATKDAFVKAYRDFKAQPNEAKIRDVAVASIAVMLAGAPANPVLIAALTEHVVSILTTEFVIASAPGPIAVSWQAIAEETSAAFQAPAIIQPSVMAAHAQTMQAGVNALAASGVAQPAPLSMFGVQTSASTHVQAQNSANATASALQPAAVTPNPAATFQPPAVIQPPAVAAPSAQAKNAANAAAGAGQGRLPIAQPQLITNLDPSVGNAQKLEAIVQAVKDIPGAIGKDGAITKLLECGSLGNNPGNLATARGAAYELRRAYDLKKSGENIIKFGEYLGIPQASSREFDIITQSKLIECKAVDWSKLTIDKINDMKSIFKQQLNIAKHYGKDFEVHSKNTLPNELKDWFNIQGIKFFEG